MCLSNMLHIFECLGFVFCCLPFFFLVK
uniref:Uncharacterized protein n=1 Tax=Rhizophora mucronata TaxID=61149 RepID=A0A2P2IVV9_RHIMU